MRIFSFLLKHCCIGDRADKPVAEAPRCDKEILSLIDKIGDFLAGWQGFPWVPLTNHQNGHHKTIEDDGLPAFDVTHIASFTLFTLAAA